MKYDVNGFVIHKDLELYQQSTDIQYHYMAVHDLLCHSMSILHILAMQLLIITIITFYITCVYF